jgi:hypothetical protein
MKPLRLIPFLASSLVLLAALPAGARANERLMLADLKENEVVVIDYFSRTGDRTLSRQYFIRGGETKLLTLHRNAVEWRNLRPHVTDKYLLGDLVLSRDEVLGLEALLVFYAAELPGNCAKRDIVQVEFYRDGKSIGRFTHQDDSCFLRNKDSEEVRAKTRGKISDALMDVLLTFADIDERVRAANS